MNRIMHLSLLILVPGLVSCSKEIGRTAFSGPEAKEMTVNLDASKEVDFWVDLDVEYKGDIRLGYNIDLSQGGKSVAKARCDALDPSTKMMSMETDIGSTHTKRYKGKMICSVNVQGSGPTVIKAVAFADPPPQSLKKLELVIKQ